MTFLIPCVYTNQNVLRGTEHGTGFFSAALLLGQAVPGEKHAVLCSAGEGEVARLNGCAAFFQSAEQRSGMGKNCGVILVAVSALANYLWLLLKEGGFFPSFLPFPVEGLMLSGPPPMFGVKLNRQNDRKLCFFFFVGFTFCCFSKQN